MKIDTKVGWRSGEQLETDLSGLVVTGGDQCVFFYFSPEVKFLLKKIITKYTSTYEQS